MKGIMVFVALLFAAPLVYAQGVYKWVDAQGQVHYGERPPEEAAATEVTIKNSPPPAPLTQQDRTANTQRVLRAFEEERMQKQQNEAKAAEEAAQRQRNCAVARDRLQRYQSAGYLYELDKNGERRVLNDAQHTSEMRIAEAEVKKYCK